MRAHGMCELCSGRSELHVGHILSVAEALDQKLEPAQFNSDDNLMAMCAQCNLGLGKNPVPLWLATALLIARGKRGQENT